MITPYASSGRGMPVKIYEHSGVQTLFMLLFMLLLAAWLAYTALTPVYDDTLGISLYRHFKPARQLHDNLPASASLMLMLALAGAALMAAFSFLKTLTGDRAALVLSPDGITGKAGFGGKASIAWEDIGDITWNKQHVTFKPNAAAKGRVKAVHAPIALIGIKPKALIAEIAAYHAAIQSAGMPAPRPAAPSTPARREPAAGPASVSVQRPQGFGKRFSAPPKPRTSPHDIRRPV